MLGDVALAGAKKIWRGMLIGHCFEDYTTVILVAKGTP